MISRYQLFQGDNLYIFEPGLVLLIRLRISGRVGMDVVKTNIGRINGIIDVLRWVRGHR